MSGNMDFPPAPAPTPAVGFSRAATTGDTVVIACKLPHGVKLRTFAWQMEMEPTRDGTLKEVKRARPTGEEFICRGTWVGSAGQAYNPSNPSVAELLPGGYALTHGCPKDLWDLWLEQNKDTLLVRNKIIFAYPSLPTVTKEAQDNRPVKSGLEPIDPARPADRIPGGMHRQLRMGMLEQGNNP